MYVTCMKKSIELVFIQLFPKKQQNVQKSSTKKNLNNKTKKMEEKKVLKKNKEQPREKRKHKNYHEKS